MQLKKDSLHKIQYNLENEHDYTLIGIHTALEDFRVAYFLNRFLDIRLERSKDDLDFKSKNCKFSFFEYDDPDTLVTWHLIANKDTLVSKITLTGTNLFDTDSEVMYLIPEKPKVDFFLKISEQNGKEFINDLIRKIANINQIVAAYEIDPLELRSKDNLIII